SSIIRRAGNSSRMSSARSGCLSAYSESVGFSPRRLRAMKSSANSSTGLRSEMELDICKPLVLRPEQPRLLRFLRHRKIVDPHGSRLRPEDERDRVQGRDVLCLELVFVGLPVFRQGDDLAQTDVMPIRLSDLSVERYLA